MPDENAQQLSSFEDDKQRVDNAPPEPLPAPVVANLSHRYLALKTQSSRATTAFEALVAERSVLKQVFYAKAATLSEVVECMIWAQALQDATWQPIAAEVLKHSYPWEREKLQKCTTRLGIDADFAAVNSDVEFKRLVFVADERVQASYRDLVSELQVTEDFESITREITGAEFFMKMLTTYMKTQGYFWSESKKMFSRAL